MIILFVLLFFLVSVLIIIALYCHVKKYKDQQLFSGKSGSLIPKKRNNLKKEINLYLYGLTRYLSIVVGNIPSMRIRKAILRYIFAMDIHKDCIIYGGCEFRSPWKIKLGRCIIGARGILDGRNGIVIEDDVCLATAVYIWTEQHDVNDLEFKCNDKGGEVYIKRHAWVSSRTTILPRVTIGEGAVIACGAVVSKDCDDYGIYVGVPAYKKQERNRDIKYILGDDYWHFY